MSIKDRIKGAIYGVAVSDALGSCCEGFRPGDIRNLYGVVKDHRGGGNWSPGEFTDDTWLTLAACRAYDDKTFRFNPQMAGDAMVMWMRKIGKGIGLLTNVALSHLSSGRGDIYTSGKKAIANRKPGGGAGNGSLMRCIATGLVHSVNQIDDITTESTIISEITHADPRCVAACVGYNIIVAGLLVGRDFNDLCIIASNKTSHIDKDTSNIFYKKALGEPYGYAPSDMKHMGYVLRALDRSLAAMNNTIKSNSFEDEIIAVVNEGGDADTNAAISGGLLGAYHGFKAIPKRWVDGLFDDEIQELDEAVEILTSYRNKVVV
jgi:ADP-ribosyl-[dinitrogen reductase] hydrolase